MDKHHSVDIIIPSFNAKHLLEKNLPIVIKHAPEAKIIVVDDGSTDGTPDFLKEHFPEVICLHHDINLGFSKSMNLGFKASRADFVCLLNNDVYPRNDFIAQAMPYFSDPYVFGVSFNEEKSSWPEVSWKNGKLHFQNGLDKTKPRYSAWLSGGSGIARKSHLDKLEGFREIYSPGYWEDIDLGWRAWKEGYKIVWAPEPIVVHDHESTFKKLNPRFVSTLKERNELLFIWQNICDDSMKQSHLRFLLKHTLTHPGYFRIVFKALIKFLSQGKIDKGALCDQEILNKINQEYVS